jgi:hypothetical protein
MRRVTMARCRSCTNQDPYLAAGFGLTERNGGWELILPG